MPLNDGLHPFTVRAVQTAIFRARVLDMGVLGMEKILCNISALRFYRVPPRYLYMMPNLPDFDTPFGRSELRGSPAVSEIFGLPIHALDTKRSLLHSTLVRPHRWDGPLPMGSIRETPHDVSVTSPLLTLLMLAYRFTPIQLAMLLYELVGKFTFFTSTQMLEEACKGLPPAPDWEFDGGWKMVRDAKGGPSGLWQRPPLLTMDQVNEFIDRGRGVRGRWKLAQAMRYVTGVTRSPFEACASMLLCAPRRLGGRGFGGVQNNFRIDLSEDARTICGLSYAEGDLTWPATARHPTTIVECQGRMTHSSVEASESDDDRALALENMGIDLVRITYKQISDEDKFELLSSHLGAKLGVRQRPPSGKMVDAEKLLRQSILTDWSMLNG